MGNHDPRLGRSDGTFDILGQSAASSEPGECPFDNPSTRQNREAFRLVRSLDDLDRPAPELLQPPLQLVARITTIGEDMQQPWPLVTDGFQEIGRAVAILDIGTMHRQTNHQTERIDDDMTLAAFGLLARIIARRQSR